MISRSVVGRFLILAILIVAVGVVGQAALIMMQGGKKVVKTASAATASTPARSDQPDEAAGQPIRVVYPGPLGDTAQKPKLAESATASPLSAPSPDTTAKLAQAMTGSAATAPPSPAVVAQPTPAPQPPPAASPAPETVAAAPQPLQAPSPAAAPAPAAQQPDPASAAAGGVEVASLGGGAPADDAAPSGGVNINTASIEALNRLGGGHIGQSIVKHRPYQSVADLVKKRVLRRSVFDHIRNEIAAR